VPCSEQPALEDIAWYCNNSGDEVHPVAQKLPNPWGLYDTLGNVYEWVDSYWGPLNVDGETAVTDPIGPLSSDTVEMRSSSFSAYMSGCLARPSNRWNFPPTTRIYDTGFRPVRTIFE